MNRTDDPYFIRHTRGGGGRRASGTATSGKYEGVASGSNLVNLRVLNSKGTGSVSGILKALDWIITNRDTYKIRVVNMSLGAPAISSYHDSVCQHDPISEHDSVCQLADSSLGDDTAGMP